MGFFRWLWRLLFQSGTPDNRETQALWLEAQALLIGAQLSLYPGNWARETVEMWTGNPDSELTHALIELVEQLLKLSGLYDFPPDNVLDYALADMEEGIRLRETLRQKILLLKQAKHHEKCVKDLIIDVLFIIISGIETPSNDSHQTASFRVPLLACVPEIGEMIAGIVSPLFSDEIRQSVLFSDLRDRIRELADPILAKKESISFTDHIRQHRLSNGEAVTTFLRATPFEPIFSVFLPFAIPEAVRFEHMHIVAGSGHGKTQTLQHIILADIERAKREKFGFVLIDSQGDLIDKITKLAVFDPDHGELANRLVIIDPNDLKHPAGLNLFDHNLSRFEQFSELEQEKIFHGVLELYGYIFSALLGAELTQKQGVVFTNLARAMMMIPDPTIYTFYDFVEDGTKFRSYIEKLDGIPRRFFETQFFTKTYDQTRQQIITRLLGVLGNPAFERMFAHPKNNIDMFAAMQRGDIVLVNTAKDLLKSEGSSILGRFFIALITQATLARAAISERERIPYHLYIDEAQEYFDRKTDELLNQGRKFRVGVTLAHQHLSQLDTELKATLKASTSIKLAGGVNHADALALAQEMNCGADFIQGMRKSEKRGFTEFACYIRHHTEQPVKLAVPFGVMERLPRMEAPAYMRMIEKNRARVAYKPELPAPKVDVETSGKSTEPKPPPDNKTAPADVTLPPETVKPADDLGFQIKVDHPPNAGSEGSTDQNDDFYV